MASSSSSESSSKVSKKNYYYDWTIKEVDKLYSTLIDLQKMQQVFNQLITRVEFLEKKLGIIGTDSNALTKAKSINSIPRNGRSEIQECLREDRNSCCLRPRTIKKCLVMIERLESDSSPSLNLHQQDKQTNDNVDLSSIVKTEFDEDNYFEPEESEPTEDVPNDLESDENPEERGTNNPVATKAVPGDKLELEQSKIQPVKGVRPKKKKKPKSGKSKVKKRIPKSCTICGKILSDCWHLKVHMLDVHNIGDPVKCIGCGEIFQKYRKCASHKDICKLYKAKTKEPPPPKPCKLCNNNSIEYTPEEFKEHIKEVHTDLTLGEANKPRNCPVCLKRFERNVLLWYHLNSVHQIEPLTLAEIPIVDPNLRLQCKLCENNVEYTTEEFRVHFEKLHKIPKADLPKPCPICLKVFKWKHNLKLHLYAGHKIGEIIQCDLCSKKFTFQNSLKKHLLIVHKERRKSATTTTTTTKKGPDRSTTKSTRSSIKEPHQCTQCGKLFKFKCSLKSHIPACSGLSIHKCKECDLVFKHASGLYQHVRKDHLNLHIRRHLCNECGKSFYKLDHLNRHIKEVHRNDKSGLYKRRRKPKDTPKEDVKVTTANPVTDEMFTNDEALQEYVGFEEVPVPKVEILIKPSYYPRSTE